MSVEMGLVSNLLVDGSQSTGTEKDADDELHDAIVANTEFVSK
jgi:hypothetical protein